MDIPSGFPSPGSAPLSVCDLTRVIKSLLEESFPLVAVEGEISNFKPASSGHWYFTLKDEEAMIGAVMFRNRAMALPFQPCDGMKVVLRGSLSVYAKRGGYQIIAESMEEAGLGRLLAELEERKRRLAAEGLFDASRKKPLPFLPARVAVVTSPTGAALRDILQVTGRRACGLDIVVVPVPVQGADAGPRIARGLELADTLGLGDVIILGRGGGSVEDLMAFSDEVVVRAVAACSTPVISAVGHEIDTSLSDLAADVRAPTPSAAAELVAASREDLLRRVMDAGHHVADIWKHRLARTREAMKPFGADRMEESWRQMLQPWMQRLDDAKEDLLEGASLYCSQRKERIRSLTGLVESLSPLEVLKRGYAAVRQNDHWIQSAGDAEGAVEILWADGTRTALLDPRSDSTKEK